MKKIILLLCVCTLFACKSGKNGIPNTVSNVSTSGLDNKAEVMIKGDWILTRVNYPGSDYLKVKSFQIADSKCFIGSKWNFISNNNKGGVSMQTQNCSDFSSPIVWSVNKEKIFSLKILKDEFSKDVKVGFYLQLTNQTETSFDLVDKIPVGGKLTEIVYTFEKK